MSGVGAATIVHTGRSAAIAHAIRQQSVVDLALVTDYTLTNNAITETTLG